MTEQWKNNERVDKPHLSVKQTDSGDWAVMINDTVAMEHCPCCMKRFAKAEHAMRCVDVFWPPDSGVDIKR
jgi:poly-beta-hydroxyalkanoate depolymerase